MPGPRISVIIPTYNWSAALALALQSVRLQTIQDFEVLVVGDGCTDDSEEIVAGFADPRFRWYNLSENFGSQWAANNFANERAQSPWVAYLGHDDIWYPTHLAAILETAEAKAADVVTSEMMIYGPPGSHVVGVAGIFPDGIFRPDYFVPPSAFAHATRLYGDVVRWRDPDDVRLPMDAAFLNELALGGTTVASTGQLTCFKFNAALRRDSYITKSVVEQEAMLERVKSGIDFRPTELKRFVSAVVSNRHFFYLQPSVPDSDGKGSIVKRNRRLKGLDDRFGSKPKIKITSPVRFDMAEQEMPFEWHLLEDIGDGTTIRWSGPNVRSTIDLPVDVDGEVTVCVKIYKVIDAAVLSTLELLVHDQVLETTVQPEEGGAIVTSVISPEVVDPRRTFGVTVRVDKVVRPCDISDSPDDRWLGVAVSWIELASKSFAARSAAG